MALTSTGVRAVGRPAASCSERVFIWLVKYVKTYAERVIVIGDNDPVNEAGRRVGRDEAKKLAERLAQELPKRIVVRWALPLRGFKDVREQIAAGRWCDGLREKGVQE